MNTDEKNDKLKFCLKEVGSLITQLIDRNQLNLISQDNKENLLILKKGIDGLIGDGLLHTDPKDSVQKTNSAATPTDTSAPESVDWKMGESKSIFGTKPEISQDLLDEMQKIQDENVPKPELDEDGNVIHYEPKSIVGARGKEPIDIEKELLFTTHNALVELKLQKKRDTRHARRKNKNGHEISAQKYKQVKESDKVRDYRQLEGRYKHARSFSTHKTYLRKVSWFALQMGGGEYDSVSWYTHIQFHHNIEDLTGGGVKEYAEIIDDVLDDALDQIGKSGNKILGNYRKPKDATNLEKKMIVEDA